MASSSDNSERRRARRVSGVLAIAINSETKKDRLGITRDLSERGLLVVTPSRFASGERLDVTVWTAEKSVHTVGRIARVAENAKDSPETWRYRMAIVLDEPLPEDVLHFAAETAA